MARDPYRYFRVEARELVDGLAGGARELERDGATRERVALLLRLAHTLKGAARVVKAGEIAELAHAVEGLLVPHRDAPGPVPPGRLRELVAAIDGIDRRLAALAAPQAAPETARAPAPPEASARAGEGVAKVEAPREGTTLRVEVGALDALLDRIVEAAVTAEGLSGIAPALEEARRSCAALEQAAPAGLRIRLGELRGQLERLGRGVGASLERVDRSLAEARADADRLRLVPASSGLSSLERVVRDAARALGREVALAVEGAETRLDAHVLAAVAEALPHVLRNAVAHGVEPPPERRAAKKPPAGRLTLAVERRGARVVFACKDDGRGVDLAAVRRAAAARGLLSAAAADALDLEGALALLLRGGLSTASALTEVAGRGIGLEAVQALVARVQGRVRLTTAPGAGTTVELDVPSSLVSVASLRVEAGGWLASVPLDGVLLAVRLDGQAVVQGGGGEALVHDGATIPLLALQDLLAPGEERAGRARAAVVLQAGARRAALGVEAIRGLTTVIVRPLPAAAGPAPAVWGASLDAAGDPLLALDPAGVVEAAHRGAGARAARGPRARPPILCIDDSLTTRMLEQSILEAAGYEVTLASSAEEGLEKARQRSYGLFLVDVEMPGMDGFQFVTLTRADPELRKTPAILLTSRGSPDDVRRGQEAGAAAHMIKGEFDQRRLLALLERLLG